MSLGRVRDGWDEIEAEETRLLRQMTVQESLRQFLALQRAFEPQLQQPNRFSALSVWPTWKSCSVAWPGWPSRS